MKTFDVCVIGAGGVVGSAILRDLSQRGLSVVGLEKHRTPAVETSGLNSRVIHSGFHETHGTMKAQLASAGSRMIAEYASRKGIRLLRTGMLIAVPRHGILHGLWREYGSLWHLWRGGRAQNVAFQWIMSRSGIQKIAPIEAVGGIFIPSVCVVDVMQLITSMQRDAVEHFAEIYYGSEVRSIAKSSDHYLVATGKGNFRARSIVNSAGLGAPAISRIAGGPDYPVERIRGEYYELRGGMDRWKIRTLVYPALPARSRSKGIHFGPHTDGRLFIGPDAASVDDPPTPRNVFLKAAQKFLPDITDADLEYSCAGVRSKYGSDFLIRLERTDPPLLNLIGIDSPGLSSSMAIGEHVGKLLSSSAALSGRHLGAA